MNSNVASSWVGRHRKRLPWIVGAVFLAVGLSGAFRYADSYWLYRGFPPPTLRQALRDVGGSSNAGLQVASVRRGKLEEIFVGSPAVGGRAQPVWVYLPPGYANNPAERYDSIYFLHGFPGSPMAFIDVGRVDLLEDVLLAEHRVRPFIAVMPLGSTGTFRDKEWADGATPDNAWETYLARDVVNAIDARFRTIRSGAARAIMGLSEGAYGALNVGLHHPEEFHVIESWSGYMDADPKPSIFDHSRRLVAYNSPMLTVRTEAPLLRANHDFVWFYCGAKDRLLSENEQFAEELRRLGIDHRFFYSFGGHNWNLWRNLLPQALIVASGHMAAR
jgi:enterochelin esterase-like enzyme